MFQAQRDVHDFELQAVRVEELKQRRLETYFGVFSAEFSEAQLPHVVISPNVQVPFLGDGDGVVLSRDDPLNVCSSLTKHLVPECRHELRLTLVRLRLPRLVGLVVDAKLAETIETPRVHAPVSRQQRGCLA
jgi:hypothetical protein